MFKLDNILSYANSNIQIIGIFIAIIGGLIATKLLNAKIEKDTLNEKLDKINKEIRFYENEKITDERELYEINKDDYINNIYDKVVNEGDINIEDYEDYNLTLEQRKEIINEIKEWIDDAKKMFSIEHYKDDVSKILTSNHIKEETNKYTVYECIGMKTRTKKRNPIGMMDPSEYYCNLPKLKSGTEVLNGRDLNMHKDKLTELIKWKLIEIEDIEAKLKAICNLNMIKDVRLFISITIFSIIVPQIVLSIYPLFINFKWLKFIFAIYSILSFVISMMLMLRYIYNLLLNINK
jgi:hypothetical protein